MKKNNDTTRWTLIFSGLSALVALSAIGLVSIMHAVKYFSCLARCFSDGSSLPSSNG